MKKVYLAILLTMLVFGNLLSQTITVNVEKAGTLSETLEKRGLDIRLIGYLRLTGTIDARDFKCLWAEAEQGMPNEKLKVLDLSQLTRIEGYTGKGGTDIRAEEKSIVEYPAQEIPAAAFLGLDAIETVKFPNFITKIGNFAFANSPIKSIEIPNSVKTIGYRAFLSSKLVDVELPNSITEIESGAFYYSPNLETVKLPKNVKKIGSQAFENCPMLKSEFVIPKTVEKLGYAVFFMCKNVPKITIDKENTHYVMDEKGGVYSANLDTMIFLPPYFKGEYRVNPTTSRIFPNAMAGIEGLTRVILPDNLTHLNRINGDNDFSFLEYDLFLNSCNLRYVDFNNVESSIILLGGFFKDREDGGSCHSVDTIRVENRFRTDANWLKFSDIKGAYTGFGVTQIFKFLDLSKITLIVPADSVDVFKETIPWKNFGKIVAEKTTDINPIKSTKKFVVYPNPVQDSFIIQGLESEAEITIFDMTGKQLKYLKIGKNQRVPIANLDKGIYIVSVISENRRYNLKIQKL